MGSVFIDFVFVKDSKIKHFVSLQIFPYYSSNSLDVQNNIFKKASFNVRI